MSVFILFLFSFILSLALNLSLSRSSCCTAGGTCCLPSKWQISSTHFEERCVKRFFFLWALKFSAFFFYCHSLPFFCIRARGLISFFTSLAWSLTLSLLLCLRPFRSFRSFSLQVQEHVECDLRDTHSCRFGVESAANIDTEWQTIQTQC